MAEGAPLRLPALGPRAPAAARGWGEWRSQEPVRLPASTRRHARRAWRLIARRQVVRCAWPPHRPFWRLLLLLTQAGVHKRQPFPIYIDVL